MKYVKFIKEPQNVILGNDFLNLELGANMSKEKYPALSASRCHEMEQLRLAIEVLTGERVRCINIDFHTGKALYYANPTPYSEEKYLKKSPSIEVMFKRVKPFYFHFTMFGEEYSISHYDPQAGYVEVVTLGDLPAKWVGTSFAERQQEPVSNRYQPA